MKLMVFLIIKLLIVCDTMQVYKIYHLILNSYVRYIRYIINQFSVI